MKLSRRSRVAVVTIHVAAATAWLALATAVCAIQAASPDWTDPVVSSPFLRYQVLLPLVITTIASGAVLSHGTTYGFLRYYWVIIKLILTTVLIVGGTVAIVLQLHSLWVRVGVLVALIMITTVATVKPPGRTSRWHKPPKHERHGPRPR